MGWHGRQQAGAARERRAQRRAEAEARNARTPESRRRQVRLAADLLERTAAEPRRMTAICERCHNDRPEMVPCADDTAEHCEPCCNSCEACLADFLAEQTAAVERDRRYTA